MLAERIWSALKKLKLMLLYTIEIKCYVQK